ncbi:MAG: hypothetical protein MJE68_06095 [Proteobacteria bacterium]|nr:hypothetical protein [Pseudomonadota bacterium]
MLLCYFIIDATLSYEFSSYSANEDVGVLELSIVLVEGNLERNIFLIISAIDLDAHAVEDFAILDAAVMFPDGSQAGDKLKVNVKVVDDQLVEHDEQFWMEISSEDERVQFVTKAAQITIINNDGKCMTMTVNNNESAYEVHRAMSCDIHN